MQLTIDIANHSLHIMLPPRATWDDQHVPKNFGIVSAHMYRGGWPTPQQLNRLQAHYGVTHLVTLQSDAPGESQRVAALRQAVASTMQHHVLTVQDAPSFITAAQHIVSLEGTAYIHCSAGANRTGKTVLAVQILQTQKSEGAVTQLQLVLWLTSALSYGFDYDKPYKKVLEEMLSTFAQQGAFSFIPQRGKEQHYVFPFNPTSTAVRR